MALRQKQIM